MAVNLSSKVQPLQPEDRERYLDKIRFVDGVDPYTMDFDSNTLPLTVDYDKICSYLIFKHSFRTGQPHMNRKSLDSYKSFLAGFVETVKGCRCNDAFVVYGKVLHSMSINDPSLECWIIISDLETENEEAGTILSAHCTCTAGAGETCTHVSAVLYALSHARELCLGKQISVTELPAYWTAPSGRLANLNLFATIDQTYFGRRRETFCDLREFNLERTDDEYMSLIRKLEESGLTVAASQAFFLNSDSTDEDEELIRKKEHVTKLSMTNRYEECYEDQSLEDLRSVVKFMDWNISQQDCDLIEEMTRDQSADPLWFKMRVGRVTASIFSRCVKTSTENPSKSLLDSIFTENSVQNIPACIYGRENEVNGIAEALNAFRANNHRNVSGRNSGLVISPNYPFFAASPDHIISCDCCGKVTVEVKCPFKFDHLSKEEAINVLVNRKPQSSAYIIRNSNGRLAMNHEHPYYYQVQAQIFLCEANYGFFVVWARKFSIFIKVTKNNEFWEANAKKAEDFFEKVIGPEIIGHYYTSHK